MNNHDLLISTIDERLTRENFRLWRMISMQDSLDTDIFASRVRWMVGRNSEHVFVQYKVSPRREDFERLFDDGLSYAKRAFPTSIPMQLWSNYKLIGCIATVNASPALVDYVTQRPASQWRKRIVHGYFQLPVLLDLSTGKTHYYRGFFHRGLQKIVRLCIEEEYR